MDENAGDAFTGTVEIDETYIGGKFDKRRKRARWDKPPVFGIIERGTEDKHSRISAGHITAANRFFINPKIKGQVSPEAKVMTDESRLYDTLGKFYEHEIVNHSGKEWVRGDVHTQGVDGFWSLLKRGIIASFHQVSVKHLDRYISEFQFRFNNREDQEIFAAVIIGLVIKTALRYKALTASEPSVPPTSDEPPFGDEPF
jgi:transposase-like protein